MSYQLSSDYREHWLLQYILTRPDFVHHKTSQRESHKHLQFQYNYSTFCLCTLETKLHQRLPVEKRKPFYITGSNMHIMLDVLLTTYSYLILSKKTELLSYMNVGLDTYGTKKGLRNTFFAYMDCFRHIFGQYFGYIFGKWTYICNQS